MINHEPVLEDQLFRRISSVRAARLAHLSFHFPITPSLHQLHSFTLRYARPVSVAIRRSKVDYVACAWLELLTNFRNVKLALTVCFRAMKSNGSKGSELPKGQSLVFLYS